MLSRLMILVYLNKHGLVKRKTRHAEEKGAGGLKHDNYLIINYILIFLKKRTVLNQGAHQERPFSGKG